MAPVNRRDHVIIHQDELRDLLGMTGTVLKVYAEPDGEYVHMITAPVPGDINAVLTTRGGHVESRERKQLRARR